MWVKLSLGFARADKIFKNNKKEWSEFTFSEKDISNSLKQNAGCHHRKKPKVTPVQKVWLEMQHLLSKKLILIVNKCDQILKSRIFFWRLFSRHDIKLYTRYVNQELKCRQRWISFLFELFSFKSISKYYAAFCKEKRNLKCLDKWLYQSRRVFCEKISERNQEELSKF